MEISAVNGMFRLFQTSLFSNNLSLRKHLYYQFLVYFRVVGNHTQRVKYLHRVDVNIDCRTENLGTENLLGFLNLYKATITTAPGDARVYTGMTEYSFKTRLKNHKVYFKHRKHLHDTFLCK